MLRYGAVLLRGSDVRSHVDFVAVSHSPNCGTPAPRSYCFFCELASSVGWRRAYELLGRGRRRCGALMFGFQPEARQALRAVRPSTGLRWAGRGK